MRRRQYHARSFSFPQFSPIRLHSYFLRLCLRLQTQSTLCLALRQRPPSLCALFRQQAFPGILTAPQKEFWIRVTYSILLPPPYCSFCLLFLYAKNMQGKHTQNKSGRRFFLPRLFLSLQALIPAHTVSALT